MESAGRVRVALSRSDRFSPQATTQLWRRAARSAICILLLAACQDATAVGESSGSDVSVVVLPCDQQIIPEPGCEDPGPPAGGGINPADTYVAANVEQSYTTTILDPVTGAPQTLASSPVSFKLEAGFSTASGLDIVQHVYADPGEDDGIRVARVEGNSATEWDFAGNPTEPTQSEINQEVLNPLATMPDLSGFPSVIDVIASGEVGTVNVSAVANQMSQVSARVAQLQNGTKASMVDGSHLSLSIAGPANAGQSPDLTASFERVKSGQWVLRTIENVTVVRSGNQSGTLLARFRVKGLRVRRNHDADRRREAKRARRLAGYQDATSTAGITLRKPSAAVGLSTTPPEPWEDSGIIAWNPPTVLPFPFTPPTTPAPGLVNNANLETTDEERAGCGNEGGDAAFAAANYRPLRSGDRIVFQHGFGSGPCTWQYYVPRFPSYGAGGRVIGKTNTKLTYEQQAAALKSQLPAGRNNFIFVGHSNGGIISRYLAQTEPAGFARSVITINSPHAGVAVLNGIEDVYSFFRPFYVAASVIVARRSLGYENMRAWTSPKSLINQIFDRDAVILQQAAPGSQFLDALSRRSEAHFRRYALRSEVDRTWQSVRTICDLNSDAAGVPKGRRCVKDAKRTVKRVAIQSGIFKLLSIASTLAAAVYPPLGALAPSFAYVAKTSAAHVALMFATDVLWQVIVTKLSASDGFILSSSQRWPLATQERIITSADSHVGSTKSEKTRLILDVLLTAARR